MTITAEEALVSLLTNSDVVSAMVGSRVYPLVAPQDAPMPAITYQRISNAPARTHTGFGQHSVTRFQLTAQADSYRQAKALAVAIRRCLESCRGAVRDLTVFAVFVENETDGWAEFGALAAPVVRIDVTMHHNEQAQ